eukprot:2260396-Rhodomonas_salina.1
MKVRCERGMRYKIILRDREGWDTVAWCYSFDTVPGKVPTTRLARVIRRILLGCYGTSCYVPTARPCYAPTARPSASALHAAFL